MSLQALVSCSVVVNQWRFFQRLIANPFWFPVNFQQGQMWVCGSGLYIVPEKAVALAAESSHYVFVPRSKLIAHQAEQNLVQAELDRSAMHMYSCLKMDTIRPFVYPAKMPLGFRCPGWLQGRFASASVCAGIYQDSLHWNQQYFTEM